MDPSRYEFKVDKTNIVKTKIEKYMKVYFDERTKVVITKSKFIHDIIKHVDINDKTIIALCTNESETIKLSHIELKIGVNTVEEKHVKDIDVIENEEYKTAISISKENIANSEIIVEESDVKVSIEEASTDSMAAVNQNLPAVSDAYGFFSIFFLIILRLNFVFIFYMPFLKYFF